MDDNSIHDGFINPYDSSGVVTKKLKIEFDESRMEQIKIDSQKKIHRPTYPEYFKADLKAPTITMGGQETLYSKPGDTFDQGMNAPGMDQSNDLNFYDIMAGGPKDNNTSGHIPQFNPSAGMNMPNMGNMFMP